MVLCCLDTKPFFLPNDVSSWTPTVYILILHPRGIPGINYMVTYGEKEKNQKSLHGQGGQNQLLAYRVREHNKKTLPEK